MIHMKVKPYKVTKIATKFENVLLLQVLVGTLRIPVSWRLIDNDSVDNHDKTLRDALDTVIS